MSAYFGIWNRDGSPVDGTHVEHAKTFLSSYGPDSQNTYLKGNFGMVYHYLYTTKESRSEIQPHLTKSGDVVTWGGRLDNREELCEELVEIVATDDTDLVIVTSAFERWGTACFSKLVGDWSMSIYKPTQKTLILAKDYMGVRHLYYSLTPKRVCWCTHLDAIVQLSQTPLSLNDEYVAGYLASYPAAHLTPYQEIRAVPPGSFVVIRNDTATDYRYWSFDTSRETHYQTDAEYEEHFRHVFRQAVRRRLRSDLPILGELSGGIDSSSIICMADNIMAKGEAETPRLDTVSIYDPKEPRGDERSYINRIEVLRGRNGFHFDRSEYDYRFSLDHRDFAAIPVPSQGNGGLKKALCTLIEGHGYRIVLSGNGGDEFLGGVPDPCPQLADLILGFRLGALSQQLMAWSRIKRRPWIQLLFQSLVLLLPHWGRAWCDKRASVAPWVDADFARSHHLGMKQLGPQGGYGFWRPSHCDYARTVVGIRRQTAFLPQHVFGHEERRFPYLDQTLIEFLLSIPATQLLRPGQRRSLMRRSLVSIVPSEILWRRTKGTVASGVLASLENTWAELDTLFISPLSARLGYIGQAQAREGLRKAKNGDAPQLVRLLRVICLELWLRSLTERGVLRVGQERLASVEGSFSRQAAGTS